MIWDNFLFLEQIAPSWWHICKQIQAHVVDSRVDVVTLYNQMVRVARIRQGLRTRAPTCSFMLWANGKCEFFRVENKTSISRCEWIVSARAGCTRKLLHLWIKLMSGIELICEFLTTILDHNQNLFSIISCFCLFGEFSKVFERKVWRVQVAHLHSAARAFSRPNRCFKIDTRDFKIQDATALRRHRK